MTTVELVERGVDVPASSAAAAGVPLALEDLSPTRGSHRSHAGPAVWRGRLLRFLVPVALVALWQISSSAGWVSPRTLPSPSTVIDAFVELIRNGDLQRALPVSLRRAFSGLAIGATLGLSIGLWAGLWKLGEELFDAPLQILRTIPFIAIQPLLVAWFGIYEQPKITLIAAATVFPVYLNTYHGVRGVDAKLIEAGQIFGLNGRRLALRVILPTALPQILTGFRYALGTSLLALVLAEQVNARDGIGSILLVANLNQRPDIIIAGVIVYALFGIIVDIVMRVIEKLALPWRVSVQL